MKYRVFKEYYSKEEIAILKSKRTNLSFNNKDRWKRHFDDNDRYNAELSERIESRVPFKKRTSSPIIPNGAVVNEKI